jgi:hypothetical protein
MFGKKMKQPTRMQQFFAQQWPGRIWNAVIPLMVAVATVRATGFSFELLADWYTALWSVGIFILGLLLGYFVAILIGWPILGPIYYDRELKNGGPFKVGDTVQILAGPHKGRIARVYSTWQGNSVRVELGEEAAMRFEDIFQPIQILKEEDAEQQTRLMPL